MMCDGNVPYGAVTSNINRAYASAQGYGLVSYWHMPDPNLDVYQNRIRIMQQEIAQCDVLWWIDADAFFLRQDARLPEFASDIAISTDWNGVCCGVMAIRSTAWVERFLNAWILLGNVRGDRIEHFDNGQFREQTTLKALCYYWPLIEARVSPLSEKIVQCPTSTFWAKALILHMWNGWMGTERAGATVTKFLADGYRPETLQRPPGK